jgi:hypothetical protein
MVHIACGENLFEKQVKAHFNRRGYMSASNEQLVNNWLAEGDTPVQANSHVSQFEG